MNVCESLYVSVFERVWMGEYVSITVYARMCVSVSVCMFLRV